jgi:hypothetical protein
MDDDRYSKFKHPPRITKAREIFDGMILATALPEGRENPRQKAANQPPYNRNGLQKAQPNGF